MGKSSAKTNAVNRNNDHPFGVLARMQNRLLEELNRLTEDPDVQSYFRFESSGPDKISNKFYIYGYLKPESEPYRRTSYRVRIVLTSDFPFQSPNLEFLTYIYHPAIKNENSKLMFCDKCCKFEWRAAFHIHDLIKQCVNMIDRRDIVFTACTQNYEARELYKRDYVAYENKVLAMAQKHLISPPNDS